MTPTAVPTVISVYQGAHDRRDADGALAAFGPEATVIDDGVTYAGTDRIAWWLRNGASEYTYTRTLTSVEDLGDGTYLVHNHLQGDFPGGEVHLRYRFQLRDDLIHQLVIAP